MAGTGRELQIINGVTGLSSQLPQVVRIEGIEMGQVKFMAGGMIGRFDIRHLNIQVTPGPDPAVQPFQHGTGILQMLEDVVEGNNIKRPFSKFKVLYKPNLDIHVQVISRITGIA